MSGIPEGFHTLTPYLVVRDAAGAIDFYKRAFGAIERDRNLTPDGKIMNADLIIGDSVFMLSDEFPPYAISPVTLGGSPVTLHIYVEDADALYNQAVAAGATARCPMGDAFWGDRYGQLADPFGHMWSVATRMRKVTAEELQKAAAALFGSGKPCE